MIQYLFTHTILHAIMQIHNLTKLHPEEDTTVKQNLKNSKYNVTIIIKYCLHCNIYTICKIWLISY